MGCALADGCETAPVTLTQLEAFVLVARLGSVKAARMRGLVFSSARSVRKTCQ